MTTLIIIRDYVCQDIMTRSKTRLPRRRLYTPLLYAPRGAIHLDLPTQPTRPKLDHLLRTSLSQMSAGRSTRRTQTIVSGGESSDSSRKRRGAENAVPDFGLYQELLRESGAAASPSLPKRRKAESPVTESASPINAATRGTVLSGHWDTARAQKDLGASPEPAEDHDSDDSEASADWEDVDLGEALPFTQPLEQKPASLELVLDNLSEPSKRKGILAARRVITSVDRKIRLEAHKLHLLCLLAHVHLRNKWCNSPEIKEDFRRRRLLDIDTVKNLNPRRDAYQLERTTKFMRGLKAACHTWKYVWTVINRGLSAPKWSDSKKLPRPIGGDPPMSKEDFIKASHTLSGSRDLGAQLFCTALRAVGVTARLVCSLQPLPYGFHKRGPAPVTPPNINTTELKHEIDFLSPTATRIPSWEPISSKTDSWPSQKRTDVRTQKKHMPSNKSPQESPYPVYWVEAFNEAAQKWICIDPLVTGTVGLYSKLEPPQSDVENCMSYVVAIEDSGHVKDVTQRYVKAFNAKTRKLRVNATKGGEEWWNNVLRLYHRGYDLDRDQVEDAELSRRILAEGMPANISDFRGHPLFALKRHLKRNEIISPERPCGSISAGTSRNRVTETVYRREDVKTLRSSMQWYKLGREIIENQQPMKHIPQVRWGPGFKKKRGGDDEDEPGQRNSGFGDDLDEEGENGLVGLYAESQTRLYVPPPVIDGMVPKNAYGNWDVYVPSMIPKGAIHVPHKDAAKAAKLIGVDYADAITSFEHKGRQATALPKGIIIASEYSEALYAVLSGLINQQNEHDALKKQAEMLKLWKKFLVGLRIKERLGREYGDVEEAGGVDKWAVEVDPGRSEKGKRKGKEKVRDDMVEGGGFLVEDEDGEEGFGRPKVNAFEQGEAELQPISLAELAAKRAEELGEEEVFSGGGFIPQGEETSNDGGFFPGSDDEEETHLPTTPPSKSRSTRSTRSTTKTQSKSKQTITPRKITLHVHRRPPRPRKQHYLTDADEGSSELSEEGLTVYDDMVIPPPHPAHKTIAYPLPLDHSQHPQLPADPNRRVTRSQARAAVSGESVSTGTAARVGKKGVNGSDDGRGEGDGGDNEMKDEEDGEDEGEGAEEEDVDDDQDEDFEEEEEEEDPDFDNEDMDWF